MSPKEPLRELNLALKGTHQAPRNYESRDSRRAVWRGIIVPFVWATAWVVQFDASLPGGPAYAYSGD